MKITTLLVLVCWTGSVSAQNQFRGSFLMSFYSTSEKSKSMAPLFWNVDHGKMAMEIRDEMQKKGVTKRVMFNPSDSTWIMAMEFGNVKQATRIHAAAMFRDSLKNQKLEIKTSKEKKIIEGFHCYHVTIESKEYASSLWVTDEIQFNLPWIYRLLAHCGMMSDFIVRSDWFLWKKNKGMILEVTSVKKETGESYTMNISWLQPGVINQSAFNLDGYKISDIPEGLNCGPVTETK